MEQPKHDLRTNTVATLAQGTPRRFIALGIVALLHVVLVYALAAGLAGALIQKLPEELKAEVVKEQIPEKTPPPPPPDLAKPPPPYVPPPEINITTEAPSTNAITTQSKVATPPEKPAISSPASIGRPHQCMQYYPSISQRLNEQGTVTLSFHITTDGGVSGVSVAKTSGYSRLDDAAVSCAQNWHYKPAMQNGAPVEVPWQSAVQFKLQ